MAQGVLSLPLKQDSSPGFTEPEGIIFWSIQHWPSAAAVEVRDKSATGSRGSWYYGKMPPLGPVALGCVLYPTVELKTSFTRSPVESTGSSEEQCCFLPNSTLRTAL